MNDDQSRKLNAAVAGQTVMDTDPNPAIWEGKAAVVSKKDELDACIVKIGDIDDDLNDNTGASTSKTQAREDAAKLAWPIAKSLAAFAEDEDNDELRNEIDFEWSDLRYGKDSEVVDRWRLVRDRANTHVTALDTGGYGVDAAKVTALTTAIDKFDSKKGKPVALRSDKKATNKKLNDEFDNLQEIIESLKERLVQFEADNKEFYDAVINAFEQDGSGVRHRAIEIVYLDDATGIKLSGVKSKLVEKAIEKLSGKKSGLVRFTQQEAPQAAYTLESTHPLYVSQTSPNVKSEIGKLNKITIRMVKA